jgi:hypothetical protein
MEGSGADNGLPYVARMSLLPSHLGEPGNVKSVHMMRATFRALAPFLARLSVATDYRKDFPTAPSVSPDPSSTSLWDVGLWDVSRWDDGPNSSTRITTSTRWKSIGRTGTTASPQVQVTCGGSRRPDAELVTLDLLYEQGGLVV